MAGRTVIQRSEALAGGRRARSTLPPWLALLAALWLAFPVAASAAEDAVKGDAKIVVENGFARLIIRLDDDVEATVRVAGGVAIIAFKRPIDVAVDRLSANARGYISAARRDPDGRGIRIALAQKVTVNSMAAGEKLFVDFLPDSWTGLPPGLPQDVVEDLARRAREAEKRIRQQRLLNQQKKQVAIRVRVARQPSFTRYVFELPEFVPVSADRAKDKLTLLFGAPLKFDLGDAEATLPPAVEAIDSKQDGETVSVQFLFGGRIDVRTFREDNNYIVDLVTDTPHADAPAKAQELADLIASEAAKAGQGSNAAPARPVAPVPLPPQRPPMQSSAAGETNSSDAPAAPIDATVASPSEAKPAAAEPAVSAPAAPAGDPVAPPEAPPKALAEPPPAPPLAATAAAPARPTEEPVNPNGPVKVVLRRQGDMLRLVFPFASPTPAAVFRRADTLWLVFDTAAPIDVAALIGESSRTIRNATVTRSREGQVVRIGLERPRLTSVGAEGPTWTVVVGEIALEPTQPLAIQRNILEANRAGVTIPFAAPKQLHRLTDPDLKDTLLVVTALAPARGFVKTQDFVEFSALASSQGVVIQPLADDITIALDPDKITLGRPAGLTLSTSAAAARRAVAAGTQASAQLTLFDRQLWGFDHAAKFDERQTQLMRAAAEAPEPKRGAARLDLARFYLARDLYPEAKAVLDVAMHDERPNAEDSTPAVLHALTNLMLNRPDQALKDLTNPLVGNQHDAPLWRAFALARQGKWPEAHEGFQNAWREIATLPIELQRLVLVEALRASIEVRDFAAASKQLSEFSAIGIPHELEPALAVLTGRVDEGLGKPEEAQKAYRTAADSWDRPQAAQGRLRDLALRYGRGEIKRGDMIEALESLGATWRGDDTEIEVLQFLARLYTEEQRYRDAFHVMRTALRAHPNSDLTRRIQEEAAASFDSLFLAGKGDTMPAIEALSLFYDFRELTPIGRRGDEMIRRLADRLVSVDLLDQAAELLQHQVDHRLEGAARAQVATRLAVIYLMNRKPDRALATLRSTRTAELNNELRNQRLLLEARALSDIGRNEVAIEVIANIDTREATRLRSDILWAAKRWRESAEQIELLYGDRWKEWAPLSDVERADVLRAAVGYTLAEDTLGLQRFREKFAPKMAEGPDRHAFEVASQSLGGDRGEFRDIAKSIAAVDTLEGFLRDMRARYPDMGAIPPAPPVPTAGSQGRLAQPDVTATGALPEPSTFLE